MNNPMRPIIYSVNNEKIEYYFLDTWKISFLKKRRTPICYKKCYEPCNKKILDNNFHILIIKFSLCVVFMMTCFIKKEKKEKSHKK